MSGEIPSVPVSAGELSAVRPSPWRLIASVTVPFWTFMTATRVAMFLLTTARNPLVIIAPPSVRILQHLLLFPILMLCFRAALAIGWPEHRRWLAALKHAGLAFLFALCARPVLVTLQALHDND